MDAGRDVAVHGNVVNAGKASQTQAQQLLKWYLFGPSLTHEVSDEHRDKTKNSSPTRQG